MGRQIYRGNMDPEISIILNSYNPSHQQAHMTMACLAAIRKFTEEPYELIVVENDNPTRNKVRDDYGVLRLDSDVVNIFNEENRSVSYSYHQGAQVAKGKYLMFIQSDVFVHEGTITKLAKYLEKYDAAFPQQIPISREDVKQIYATPDGELTHIGQRDAGLIVITKEAYERCGGWDIRTKNLLAEKAFWIRWDRTGVSWVDHTNAFITHIMGGSNWAKDHDAWEEEMAYDANVIKEFYE